jgi:hypothetical protein
MIDGGTEGFKGHARSAPSSGGGTAFQLTGSRCPSCCTFSLVPPWPRVCQSMAVVCLCAGREPPSCRVLLSRLASALCLAGCSFQASRPASSARCGSSRHRPNFRCARSQKRRGGCSPPRVAGCAAAAACPTPPLRLFVPVPMLLLLTLLLLLAVVLRPSLP